jgi:hypothetical protein
LPSQPLDPDSPAGALPGPKPEWLHRSAAEPSGGAGRRAGPRRRCRSTAARLRRFLHRSAPSPAPLPMCPGTEILAHVRGDAAEPLGDATCPLASPAAPKCHASGSRSWSRQSETSTTPSAARPRPKPVPAPREWVPNPRATRPSWRPASAAPKRCSRVSPIQPCQATDLRSSVRPRPPSRSSSDAATVAAEPSGDAVSLHGCHRAAEAVQWSPLVGCASRPVPAAQPLVLAFSRSLLRGRAVNHRALRRLPCTRLGSRLVAEAPRCCRDSPR